MNKLPSIPAENGWPVQTILMRPRDGDLLVLDTDYVRRRGGFNLPGALATFEVAEGGDDYSSGFRLHGEPPSAVDEERQRRADSVLDVLPGTPGYLRPGCTGDGINLMLAGRERDGYEIILLATEAPEHERDGGAAGRGVWLLRGFSR